MNNPNLHNITNHFQDIRLISLKAWAQANEFEPRDRGGPYVVTQEGYDPSDLTVRADEFVLGRSGKWLSLSLFFGMPVPERRAEFVFGTAAEVMKLMDTLPTKVAIFGREELPASSPAAKEPDEMAAAIKAGKSGESAA